ncbi:O-methyltransferase MdmC [Arthroderma uncinatum]|uniref:O-methyltransferase MdmC n=1 Tax=Arthroderma uncinatum TaxID=74035 RepID=UPI00144AB84D|nr:O-methyltransferase MdmC [Arthroderma uncinatum]KAF3481084.1 O-methyltransferase MdmC [Arthroderma uncinatum]
MKEDTPILYPNERVGARVGAYAQEHTTGIPRHIVEYHGYVCDTMPETANYMVSTSQAQAMSFLAKTLGAKRILEVGVYVGLSSLVWSHAVGPEGRVTGLEFDPSFANLAEEAFKKYGVKNVEVIVGDALKTLPALSPTAPYDMIFIDAQKSGYPEYLKSILESSLPGSQNRLLRPGGLIIGDNTLRCSFVADDSEDNPWRQFDFGPRRSEYWKSDDIKTLRRYNEMVTEADRLENWLCPLWDGINISRLLD